MKKSIIISELEKNLIREQHQSYKNFLKEDLELRNQGLLLEIDAKPPEGDEIITQAMALNCSIAVGGTIVTGTDQKKAIVKMASAQGGTDQRTGNPKYVPGDILYIKQNYTFDVYDGKVYAANKGQADKMWSLKGSGYGWKCDALNAQVRGQEAQQYQAYIDQGWTTYDKLANPQKANDPNYYTREVVPDGKGGNVYLYRATAGTLNPGTYPPNSPQDRYLKEIELMGYTTNPGPGSAASPVEPPQIPGYDLSKMFPYGLKIFYDQAKASTADFTYQTQLLQGMTPQEEGCFQTINDYFGYFQGGDKPPVPGTEGAVSGLKAQVERCQRSYISKWNKAVATPPSQPGAFASGKRKQEYKTAKANYDKITRALNILNLFKRKLASFDDMTAPGARNKTFLLQNT